MRPITNYTWRPEWIVSKFESPWGIFEKFKYANVVNNNDLMRIFGDERLKSKSKNNWKKSERDLINLTFLDSALLERILGNDIKSTNYKNINNLVKIFNCGDDVNLFIRKDVHYCPKCIQLGYHSIFHQLNYLTKCPYHDIELISKCPNCHSKIVYSLDDNWGKSPFVCKCGHSLCNDKMDYGFIKKWIEASNIKISLNDLNVLLNVNKNQKYFLSNIYYSEKLLIRHFDNFLNNIVSLIAKTETKHYLVKSSFQKDIYKKSFSKLRLLESPSKNQYLETLFNNLKSIYYKQLKKNLEKLNKDHKKCLSKFLYSSTFIRDEYCPFSYAFVFWRKNIERHKYSRFPEVAQCKKSHFKESNFKELIYNNHYIHTQNNLMWEIFDINNKNFEILNWVMCRIYSHYLISDYQNRLNVAQMHLNNNLYEITLQESEIDIPFYIAYIDLKNYKAEFHWWDTQEHKNNNCPNKLLQ